MSTTHKDKAKSLATPATYLKQQEEYFETQNKRIEKFLENVFTYERILSKVRQWRKYEQDEELVHAMEDAIQKTKHQIAQIRVEQRVQFDAYLAISETVSESELPTISEEQEASFEVGGVGNQREGLWPYTEEPHQLSYNRVETLRGPASGPTKASGSQAPLQQEAWSLDAILEQLGPQAYRTAWMSGAVINELLRKNMEKQRVVLAGLQRSKEEILKLRKEIERDGNLEEDVLHKWTADVEAFLKATEVVDWRGDGEAVSSSNTVQS